MGIDVGDSHFWKVIVQNFFKITDPIVAFTGKGPRADGRLQQNKYQKESHTAHRRRTSNAPPGQHMGHEKDDNGSNAKTK